MHYPILIRIDDVCPTMNEAKFNHCLEVLDKYKYKPLLGIIPDCKDESLNYGFTDDFWEKIRSFQQNGYPIAMHGLHHCYTHKHKGLVCNREKSEFAGLPLETQYEMLATGKEIMRSHDVDTEVFFAPGHSYDRNTLIALQKAGFSTNSDGRSFWPYKLEGILNIPANGAFRLHFGRGVLTIVLHPSLDSEKTYAQLESYLRKNQDHLISWSDTIDMRRRPYCWCRLEEKVNMEIDSLIETTARLIRR